MIRLDPDSELAKDMKKLKETENLDHVLLHLLFEVRTCMIPATSLYSTLTM